jgi:hypothetical protein
VVSSDQAIGKIRCAALPEVKRFLDGGFILELELRGIEQPGNSVE